jgi:hypothetical protein
LDGCSHLGNNATYNITMNKITEWSPLLCSFLAALAVTGCPQPTTGGRWHRFAGGGRYIGSHPAISPDGTKILYSSPRSGHGDIFVYSLEDGTTQQLTNSPSYEGDASWSPCSTKIVFVREDEDFKDCIWVMDATGENQKPLHCGNGYSHGPTLAPVETSLRLPWQRTSEAPGQPICT